MSELSELLDTVSQLPGCKLERPTGFPDIEPGHQLPADVKEFYELCGGASLFIDAPFALYIPTPEEMVLANPVIAADLSDADMVEFKASGDISWYWHIIAKADPTMGGRYVTIDLNPNRLGYCYDSNWINHPGNSEIIATSFTEFLRKVVADRGETWYWDEPDFEYLGSPYHD